VVLEKKHKSDGERRRTRSIKENTQKQNKEKQENNLYKNLNLSIYKYQSQ
jgi:hypothetical protein